MTKRIIQIVLAVVIVCLIYVIYKQISTPIIFAKEKAAREARVIDRIKDLAQTARGELRPVDARFAEKRQHLGRGPAVERRRLHRDQHQIKAPPPVRGR